jgi:putative SOS response-associated peptidase YedK
MPVIIERKDYARWLDGGNAAQPPLDLLRPFPAEQMIAWKVDQAVGNVRNDTRQLLAPPEAAEDCA